MREEVYFSVDVEANGPIPGKYSMLSIGAAAYSRDKFLDHVFEVNLNTLPGGLENPSTMKFWDSFPEAYKESRKDTIEPLDAMIKFNDWVQEVLLTEGAKTPVFVAYPAGFDFTFVYWYFINFIGHCPFSYAALDLKTMAMSLTKKKYRQVSKRNLKKIFKSDKKHTHIALDDALEQGDHLLNLFRLQDEIVK